MKNNLTKTSSSGVVALQLGSLALYKKVHNSIHCLFFTYKIYHRRFADQLIILFVCADSKM